MKEKEEGRAPSPRRLSEDLFQSMEEDPAPVAAQPVDSLRDGYSWIRTLESCYPGWHLHPVDGFFFTLPQKKLSDSKICLVSFAGVYRKGQKPFNTSAGVVPPQLRAMHFKDRGDWSFREVTLDADSSDLAIAHAHYDHSEADEDINCVFPMIRLVELEVDGFIGECSHSHFALMGFVPEVSLIAATAQKEIIPRLKERGVDGVVISGGCEMSHQAAALVQREIEAAGIATVSVTVCPDITERLCVPRAVALRFPMGCPFGASMDASMQLRVLRDALSLLETAKAPGEIVRLPYDWIKT